MLNATSIFSSSAAEQQRIWSSHGHKHLFFEQLGEGLSELWSGPTAGLRTLLAQHSGPISAQSQRNGQAEFHISPDVSRAGAEQLLAHGVAVQLLQTENSFPIVSSLVTGIRDCLGIPASVVISSTIFVSPPGSSLGRHYDDKSVWVFGIRGNKRFVMQENSSGQYALPVSASVAEDELGTSMTVDVGPGNCLYMPQSYWHRTVPTDALVWSLSIGVLFPTVAAACAKDLRTNAPVSNSIRVPSAQDMTTRKSLEIELRKSRESALSMSSRLKGLLLHPDPQ